MSNKLIDKKVEYWKNQLLDLGKRNKMISFKESKRATLRIREPDFENLYDRLITKEEELTFQRPVDKDSDIRVYSFLSLMDSLYSPVDVKLGDIRVNGTYEDSKKTLKNLRNKSRLSLVEQGTNILYLVFGFVEWKEKGKDDVWIKSPLILVPVSITLESLNAPFVLKKYEDDIVVNPTLSYLFEKDYGITLPEFDSDEDSLEDFMTEMEELVDVRGWRILRESSLGLVSFLKINMYRDLLNNEEKIKKNPIVKAFAGDTEALKSSQISDIDFNHDRIKSKETYQVVDADSSQQDSIVMSQKGISFVMQGPPGTGKSQTITNIIAQGLADGKKILFVSEKMAALEVVYKRLQEVHLSDFCLPLHSHKANKKEILEQLERNLNFKHIKVKDEDIAKLTRLDVIRDNLREYVEDIHTMVLPLEMTFYEVYGAISQMQNLPFVKLNLDGIDEYTKDEVNKLEILVENLDMTRSSLGERWYKNPWQGIWISRLGTVQKNELKERMIVISSVLNNLDSIVNSDEEDKFILSIINIENIDDYIFTFSLYSKCNVVPQCWIGKDLSDEKKAVEDLQFIDGEIKSNKLSIDNNYKDTFYSVNIEEFFSKYERLCEEIRNLLGVSFSDEMLFSQHNVFLSEIKELLISVMKIKKVNAEMNEAYKIKNFDTSIEFTDRLLNVSEALNKIENLSSEIEKTENSINEKFNHDIYDVDFESMLKRFGTVYVSFIPYITENYKTTVFSICDKTIFQLIEKSCMIIKSLISNNYNENYFFEKYSEIDSELRCALDIFVELNRYYKIMEEAYLSDESDGNLARLHSMLDVCDVLFERAELNKNIEDLENEILVEFDRKIFDIDSESLLRRFELEYRSLISKITERYTEEVFSIENKLFYLPFENACNHFRNITGKLYSDDYIFENYPVIAEELRKVLEIFCKLRSSYEKMNAAYYENEKNGSIEKIKSLLNVSQVLLTKRTLQDEITKIEDILLENCEESIFSIDVVEFQYRFDNIYSSLIPRITARYKTDVYSITGKESLLNFENACKQFKAILSDRYTEDVIFENYSEINADLENALRVFSQLISFYSRMSSAYISNDRNGNISEIHKMLDVCEVLLEKSKYQHEINNLESLLLNECEKSIFDIDAEEMLKRFKVEYTGFFKVFKKQYREDIKQLRLGFKDIKKKISNDEAGNILQKLRERKNFINAKNDVLKKAADILGVSGLRDIDSALSREEIDTVKSLISSVGEILSRYPVINPNDDIVNITRALNDAKNVLNSASTVAKYIESLLINFRSYTEIKSDLIELSSSQYIEDMSFLQSKVNLDNKLSFNEAGLLIKTLEKRNNILELKNNEIKKAAGILGLSEFSDMDSVLDQNEIDSINRIVSEAEELLATYQIEQLDIDGIIATFSDAANIFNCVIIEAESIKSLLTGFRNYSEVKSDLIQFLNSEYTENISSLQSSLNNREEKISFDDATVIIRKLNRRTELICEKRRILENVATILGVHDFEDINSVLTKQETDEVRKLIITAEKQIAEFSELNAESGMDEIIHILSDARAAISQAFPKIEFLKSMLNNHVDYMEIKSDIYQLLDSLCNSDMIELSSIRVDAENELSYSDALSILEKLNIRHELNKARSAEISKTEVMPGVMLAGSKSALSNNEINESREIINQIMSVLEKYPNISAGSSDNLILVIINAQSVLKAIEDETGFIKSFLKTERSYEEINIDLQTLQKYNLLCRDYDNSFENAVEMFSFMPLDRDTDLESIKILIANFEELMSFSEKSNIHPEWIKFIFDKEKNIKVESLRNVFLKIANVISYINEFIRLFDVEYRNGMDNFVKLSAKLVKCTEQFESMDNWIDYRECRLSCNQNGLQDFVEQSEDISYPDGKLNKVFLKAFYYSWIESKIDKMKILGKFNSRVHNDNINKFRELDKYQLPVAQMRIREKLISEMPDKSMMSRNGDEMSVLLHELGKKRKIMPIRRLFRSIPNLLLKLKPCLMMSPLSVSYFLEAETYKFDLVIFDEASQIFPQDAIGAIFRGAQVIIAGDSKQLPPTNFFAANAGNDSAYDSDDDDEEEIISDSILEEASNTMPNRFLLWHYRSRYESLITFSNQEIYGGNLVSFPSSRINEADSGVEYIYVKNGVYENRCNKEEADVCVSLIEQHLKKHPERSLGIIAFSESQQNAIEDAVQEFRKKHREYESFFSEEKESAFFVKNLENVQGDERDTIIFSICYGKNSQGRMYMRFGPLGHAGGERRLNVAITRAKYNVKLVGSILPGDIDLSKTKSDGVKMLRKYIEFAAGTDKDSCSIERKNKLYENDLFSENVAVFLENKGYKVKRNVGTSEYTVDIAVEHPDIPGAYVAGIECDGDAYRMARTVRDRDHLRTAVMEKMGWKMYRVWSTEWIQNEQTAKKKLVDYISGSISNYSVFEKNESFTEEITIETEEVIPDISVSKSRNSNNPYDIEQYQEGHWWDVKKYRAHDNESRIADSIHEIIRVEQPIHLDLLYKRMAGCFGNEKVTSPIRNTVDYVMKANMSREVKIDKEKFITLSDFSSVKVRRSLPGNPDRNIEHISFKEIEEAMKIVLRGAFGLEKSVLILETSRIFGYEKTGPKIRNRMTEVIESLDKQGIIRVSDERVQLLEE